MIRMSAILLLLMFTLLTTLGCDSGDEGGEVTGSVIAATSVAITDAANEGNGSDILVTFARPVNRDGIQLYRVLIAKESDASNFNLARANAAAASTGYIVPPDESSTTLPASATDIDGDPITEGQAYVAFVLSIADGISKADNKLSNPSAAVTLAKTNLVETLVSNLPIGTGGVELDASGNVYTADFGPDLNGGGTTLYRVTPSGDASVFASGFFGASGNAIDSGGNIFQSNISAGTISKVSPSGSVSTFVSGGLAGPVGIAINASDELFVADCGGNTIHKVTPTGVLSLISNSGLLNCPNGIALGADGALYVANFSNGNIVRVTLDGVASIFATVPGSNNGHITAIPGDDGFFVVGRGSHRIYKLDSSGSLTVVAGSGQRGHKNGPALESTFSFPNDLAVSQDGKTIYVNEVTPTTTATQTIAPTEIRIIRIEIEN